MGGVRGIVRQKKIKQLQERDGNICGICKKEIRSGRFTIDHKIPRSKGGRNLLSNLQLAHAKCNNLKSDAIEFEVTEEMLKSRAKNGAKITVKKKKNRAYAEEWGEPDKAATKALHKYMKKMADMFCSEYEFRPRLPNN